MINNFYYGNSNSPARRLSMVASALAVVIVLGVFNTSSFAGSDCRSTHQSTHQSRYRPQCRPQCRSKCHSKQYAPVKIMPLGNSITCDNNMDQSPVTALKQAYRAQLYNKLTNAGYDVDFVGSRNDGYGVVPAFDSDHEGWPGWRTANLRDNIYRWLTMNPADIILLHIGTNGGNWSDKPAELDGLLDAIDLFETEHMNPITVVLAKIIQREPYDPFTATYNDQIEALALERIAEGDNIVIVDMVADAGFTTGDMYDKLHPSPTGYEKMANVWYDALVPLLDDCLYASLSAVPLYITTDQTTTLMWELRGTKAAKTFLDGKPVCNVGTLKVGPDENTTYTLLVKPDDGAAFERTLTINVVDITTLHMHFNSWGSDIVAGDGTVWESLLPYISSGVSFFNFGTNSINNYGELLNPAPEEVYYTCNHKNHSYDFPMLPNGVYTVRLHFFDRYNGPRAMNYDVEGQKIIGGFKTTRLNATIIEFPIEISDNNGLQITADQGIGNDVFESGIEIIGSPNAPPSVQFTTSTQEAYEGVRQALSLLSSLSADVEEKIEHRHLKNIMLANIAYATHYTKHNQRRQAIKTLKCLITFINSGLFTKIIDNQILQLELEHMIENCIAAITDKVVVTAVLSHATSSDVSVQLQLSGTAGLADYTLKQGPVELTIPAGKKEGSITFRVIDDDEVEQNETIVLTMDSPVNATLNQYSPVTTQVITIMEDESEVAGISLDPVGRLKVGTSLSATVFDQVGRLYEGPVTVDWDVVGSSHTQVDNLTITFTEAIPGPTTVTVTTGEFTDTKILEILGEDALWIRVNSGGPEVVDARGNVWEEDIPYLVPGFEGTTATFPKEKAIDDLIDAAPQEVYKTVRHRYVKYDDQVEKKIFIPVPDGNYTVRIHFTDGNGAIRLMSYWINDILFLEDYNPAEAAVGGADGVSIEEFDVTVSGENGISITSKGGQPDYYDSFETAYEVIANP